MQTEVPPTAGLPLVWSDLVPGRRASVSEAVGRLFDLPQPQLECSGTVSLIVALTALRELSDRRTVVIPAYTCPLVVLAIAHCGLRVRLCDLRQDHFDFDPDALTAACDADTLAVLPTHIGGRVANVSTAICVARQVGAYVIEDAAQALGAIQGGRPVGLAGDVGFFSLAVGKGLSLFEGGLLVARDTSLRERLRRVSARTVPSRPAFELRRSLELLAYWLAYRPAALRLVYGVPLRRALGRGDWIRAVGDDFGSHIPVHRIGRWRRAVGASAAARLGDFLSRTRRQAQARLTMLGSIPGLQVLVDSVADQGVWPCLMVLMPTEAARDCALATLGHTGLGVSRLFVHALPDYDYLRSVLPVQEVPHARAFAARMLTISNSPWLDDARFERVLAGLRAAAQ